MFEASKFARPVGDHLEEPMGLLTRVLLLAFTLFWVGLFAYEILGIEE